MSLDVVLDEEQHFKPKISNRKERIKVRTVILKRKIEKQQ